jgi:hypothetical protein
MALCGRGVGVERDEGVGRQASCWYGDMESTGEVCGNVSIRLEMGRQRGQGRLCMSTTAAADVKVASHDGRSGGSETAQTWRPGENLREAQMLGVLRFESNTMGYCSKGTLTWCCNQ